jgi:hypothetical protein
MSTELGAIVDIDGNRFRVTSRKVEVLGDERRRITVVYDEWAVTRRTDTLVVRPQMTNAVAGPSTATPRGVRA